MLIKVILAEDSSYQRKVITEMISSHQNIEVVDTARNGREAIQKIGKHNPDVLLLDLIMPEVDGISVLKFLSEHYPVPTIVFTGLNPRSLDDSVQALLLGAFDFILKPQGYWKEEFPKFKKKLISSILYAAKIKKTYEKRTDLIKKSVDLQSEIQSTHHPSRISVSLDSAKSTVLSKPSIPKIKLNIIVIGTSTGGPRTLKSILKDIPKDFPCPILIVQHLNSFFMKELAKSLNNICKIEVKIPVNGEEIIPGKAYLSPGGKHMKIIVRNNTPHIKIFKGEPVNFCMPSVDILFLSAAETCKKQVLGILLTGLGDDGAAGLESIKNEGGKTIAEAEQTCVVYGMPKAAIKRGAAQIVCPNYKIKDYMMKFSSKFTINTNN
ncbi:MAG: chemotaxis-specific protein-glutamate methyltransferase CheB [Promethearchaeota archaeon]